MKSFSMIQNFCIFKDIKKQIHANSRFIYISLLNLHVYVNAKGLLFLQKTNASRHLVNV